MKCVLWFLLFFITGVQAQHHGIFGQIFEIEEVDLLETIQLKLQHLEDDKALLAHQEAIQLKVRERLKRPVPVENIKHTQEARVFEWDPSITVEEDLQDHEGKVFIKAGTRINPLEDHSLSQALLFVDGDDLMQVQWATHENPVNSKIILVKGAPFELMDQHKRIFYFDQAGLLVKKLGIRQVPARVTQAQKILKIEELKLKAEKEQRID